MNSLINFPDHTRVKNIISKKLIYDKTSPSQKIKDKFVKEIEKIIWEYKLSKDTVNISSNKTIKEFQIFSIYQRDEELPEALIKFIDKAIPSPIIFQLIYNDKIRYAVSIKGSNYHYSNSLQIDSPKKPLPVVLDIEFLYYELIKQIIDLPIKTISIDQTLEVAENIKTKERELLKLERQLGVEKQFNRKVELHRRIKDLILELEEIKLG